jgi:hypothetical protein
MTGAKRFAAAAGRCLVRPRRGGGRRVGREGRRVADTRQGSWRRSVRRLAAAARVDFWRGRGCGDVRCGGWLLWRAYSRAADARRERGVWLTAGRNCGVTKGLYFEEMS